MEVTNDYGCSWVNDLIPRINIKTLQSNEDCEWLVVGAGYTGLSAARKLGQLYPNQKIILVDAQVAAALVGWNSNSNTNTGVNASSIFGGSRSLSQTTYASAKAAYDNLVDTVVNGGKGWTITGLTWTA